MHRRSGTFIGAFQVMGIFLILLIPMLIGCGHPWKAVIQARPNPFVGRTQYAVLPVSYDNLMVGETPERIYLAEKDNEKRASWEADKASINELYTNALVAAAADAGLSVVRATGPTSAPFLIRAQILMMEPGFYAAIVNKDSEIRMVVQITDPRGAVYDEIQIHRVVTNAGQGVVDAAISGTLTSGGRLKQAGEDAGHVTGKYLQFRFEGGED